MPGSSTSDHPDGRDDKDENLMIVNTLLAYGQYCISCATCDNTRHVLCSNFSSSEIFEAKDLLWKTMDFPETKRTNSTRRSADEANVVDIMNALYKLDLQGDGPMFYVSPKGIGRLPRFNPENLNVVAMDQRLAETDDQCRVLQGQVDSYRTLAMQCNNRMDEYETVLQQHTNALRGLNERQTTKVDVACVRDGSTDERHSPDVTDSQKNATPDSHAINGNKQSLHISVPTSLSDKLSVIDKTSPSVKGSPSSPGQPEDSTSKNSYASMFSKNKFQPIFNDMQSSSLFKKTPPATKSEITFFNEKLSVPQGAQTRKSSRFTDKEDAGKAFCAVSMHTRDRNDCFGGDDYSVVDQQGGEYEINPRDKQRQRHNERRRNKVIHGASTSLGSRFRGGPDAKDLSDIFVYHVACDSTIGDVKGHLKQQEIPVQQIRIDITSNKDSMYKSFRVIAPGTYKDILMSPEVWPVGVKVREYESRISGRRNTGGKPAYGSYGGGRFKK